jgi:dTDP-4-amino-4,6-dideoxygalactose transaminase
MAMAADPSTPSATPVTPPPAAAPLDLTAQEPIPEAGVQAALALMASGKLHRYGETGNKPSEVSLLEAEFAQALGRRYCVAMNSCGSTMFVALRALGVRPGDRVLANCFTLAPVPGAIAHAGAEPVLVDCADDYTIDLDDLDRKAGDSGARVLLLSHMRGHVADMDRLVAICARHRLALVEDCAHTMGAGWDGRPTGSFGAAGCFSLQSYKHANAGEGGLLVTDDDDLAAQAILMSGSYMLYRSHLARPADAVFERWTERTPNFSLRMSNLAAALARPQLGEVLRERGGRWNARWQRVVDGLSGLAHLRVPARDPREQFVAVLAGRPAATGDRTLPGRVRGARRARQVVRRRRRRRVHQRLAPLALLQHAAAPAQCRARAGGAVRSARAADADRSAVRRHCRHAARGAGRGHCVRALPDHGAAAAPSRGADAATMVLQRTVASQREPLRQTRIVDPRKANCWHYRRGHATAYADSAATCQRAACPARAKQEAQRCAPCAVQARHSLNPHWRRQ